MNGSSLPRSGVAGHVGGSRHRARAPKGTELVRLRLPDRPGSLAAVTEHLASHGVDVLRLEVVDRGGGAAVDDLLLAGDAPRRRARDARSEGHRARAAGRASTSATRRSRWRRRARRSAAARAEAEAHRQLVHAALGLVFAEAGLLLRPPRRRPLRRRRLDRRRASRRWSRPRPRSSPPRSSAASASRPTGASPGRRTRCERLLPPGSVGDRPGRIAARARARPRPRRPRAVRHRRARPARGADAGRRR